MAKSLDVAVDFLRKSIERGKEDPRYYMDFQKLHKLMFLGQCLGYVSEIKVELFEETIMANSSGPIINGLELIPGCCGFSSIYDINKLTDYLIPRITYTRKLIVNIILDKYGVLSTEELVELTKKTYGYKILQDSIDQNPIISRGLVKVSGVELYGDESDYLYRNEHDKIACNRLCETGQCPKMKKRVI